MKKIISIILILVSVLSLTSCRKKQSTEAVGDDVKTVYASFYAMYDLTRTIAEGTNIEVVNIVPAGVEPHDWEPTVSDIKSLSKADGIIYNGKGMEPWMETIKDSVGDVKMLDTTEFIFTMDDNGVTDPHVWLAPQNAKGQMIAISEFLTEISPDYAEKFASNLESVSKEIDTLDADFMTMAASAPKKQIIVTHGAYGYLCRVYGIEQIAIEGLTGESDPSPAQISSVARTARENEIKHIFYNTGESDKAAKTIAKEIEGEAVELNSFEFDSDDRDYITVMRENLEKLRIALS